MKRLFFSFIIISSLFLISCSEKIMGYSILLWNIPEQEMQAGQVLPVYIKSNISHVYVVANAAGEKFEIPLWQLTEPVKKSKINTLAEKYAENAHTYASVKLDGLPCRAEPVNTAKQVYRLRKGEVIKILYKGNGSKPMAGKNALEGDWYRILTEDGTLGWCFSYNLNLYETDVTGARIGGQEIVEEEEEDTAYIQLCQNTWYPEYFRSMIDSKDIDISKLHPSYKFTIDTENNKVTLNTLSIHESWDYEGYTKTDDREYTLKNIPIKIILKNAAFIVLRYTDESGKPQDLNFVTISENISEIITAEKERRTKSYAKIVSHGPEYSSSNYGKLTFGDEGVIKWTGFKLLVPAVIEAGSKSNGSASIKYSLSKSLQASYDGVVTFKFEGSSSEVNFLYKLEADGLRLEDTVSANFKGNQVTSRSASPVIVYFQKKQ
ncbi:MAG: SH3 domain-containing protein [Treponema sp.]|nr:SH3 domain-containing protein [Treponema sp.]